MTLPTPPDPSTIDDGLEGFPAGFDPDEFELQEDDDLALAAGADDQGEDDEDDDEGPIDALTWSGNDIPGGPMIAVVGRPNVGKSTLVNRIVGRREAVVEDVPGVTRDRVTYPTEWAGTVFTLVDTGGWDSRAAGIAARIAAQAEAAIGLSDAVIMVVDATVGPTSGDEAMVRLLRRSGRPVVVAVNKVDDMRTEPNASDFWSLGFGEPVGISAMHGRGVGDLLDRAIQAASEAPARPAPPKGLRRVALVGRPNVGKSSLLNKLAGADRVIVDSVAGTTRDPVDEVIDLDGRQWLFVDTAGIRRKVRQAEGTEFFAALRTQAALERAEVAVVVVDGSAPLAEQDVRVVANAVAAGRALVLAVNKWDLVDDERRHYLDREIERDLGHVAWAPRVNIAALTGWHVNRLTSALDEALTSWDTRVPTGRLNGLVAEITAAHPHPVRGGRQPRILYATQPATRPPRFVLFATGFIEAGYRRFIERRLRETFGFQGTPIQVSVRVRTKRTR